MRILVVGTGYVGLTYGTCLADLGNDVVCLDVDADKIARLERGEIPIFEPGLSEMVTKNVKNGTLKFSLTMEEHLPDAEVVFIAVGTPSDSDGHANLQYVEAVGHTIGRYLSRYTVIVTKSTVPVGTGDWLRSIIEAEVRERGLAVHFDMVSNPEFIREGTAMYDFRYGDRIVLGCDNPDGRALDILCRLYEPLDQTKILRTDLRSSEMTKYAANALLAVEISFINVISQLCEKIGANVDDVSEGLRLDRRIGRKAFVTAGPGFGGSCFPKDVIEFAKTFRDHGIPNGILESTLDINDIQKKSITDKVIRLIPEPTGKTVAILGLAFKADTDDIRYASSLTLVADLVARGMTIRAHDPQAMPAFAKQFPSIVYTDDMYTCVEGADVLVVMTDWNEYKQPNWDKIAGLMRSKRLVDARNLYHRQDMEARGFAYIGVGR